MNKTNNIVRPLGKYGQTYSLSQRGMIFYRVFGIIFTITTIAIGCIQLIPALYNRFDWTHSQWLAALMVEILSGIIINVFLASYGEVVPNLVQSKNSTVKNKSLAISVYIYFIRFICLLSAFFIIITMLYIAGQIFQNKPIDPSPIIMFALPSICILFFGYLQRKKSRTLQE